eukprot:jgi/Botrbrau1/6295/Bobra.0339s0006.1
MLYNFGLSAYHTCPGGTISTRRPGQQRAFCTAKFLAFFHRKLTSTLPGSSDKEAHGGVSSLRRPAYQPGRAASGQPGRAGRESRIAGEEPGRAGSEFGRVTSKSGRAGSLAARADNLASSQPERASSEFGRAGRESRRPGRESGRAGSLAGWAGRESGRASSEFGRPESLAGSEFGRAGRESGRADSRGGRAGSQPERGAEGRTRTYAARHQRSVPLPRTEGQALMTGGAAGASVAQDPADGSRSLSFAPLWQRMILAALWPEGFLGQAETAVKEFMGYMEMARVINILPSCLLVLVGAWAGAGHSLGVLLKSRVIIMSLISMSIAVASCVVNDYFDFAAGVDVINAPNKPLPSGTVPPDGALLFSFILYMWVLIAGCLLEPPLLRMIVHCRLG